MPLSASTRAWRPSAGGSKTHSDRAGKVERGRTFISGDERVFVAVHGSEAGKRAEDANALQWQYVHGRADASQLERLRGMRIGSRLVQADPDELFEVARRGEFDPDELYRELTA